jgi:ATP-binding protein involved in chromosome partitioning
MAAITEDEILKILSRIIDPATGKDVVALGMIGGIQLRDGNVAFTLEIDPSQSEAYEPVRKSCEDAVFAADGVASVTAVMTAHSERHAAAAPAQPSAPASALGKPAGQKPGGSQSAPTAQIPGIRAIVAVASGKGGVGKSTTAVNLAFALKQQGVRVGLLDADVYGPSLPRMTGLSGPPDSKDGKIIEPLVAHGVPCMSIGFLVPDDTPTIWRGPMVMGALEQLLRDVNWGELDLLLVDMPPGTGDAQLTMAQRVPLTGSVIVSTPQDVALSDVRKGINMFKTVKVPVFGIIENMSFYLCPHCGERSEIFGHGGARQTAEELGTDFLGEIPLHISIRETSDAGTPIVIAQPDSEFAKAYFDLAKMVAQKTTEALAVQSAAAPKIVMD